ncbi:nuclear transcription factor Y subunit beta isoform X2 [Phlebotomus papatasi]|uniref:nuclear transcription factor Y subunit beta isoform X2 n=1 Tax=Phlebotomus papatasi TaxID=29031 RepID=UPI0024839C2F|nr:nuclear transcription factor Y subunit beta isoform X2 [Phlebotomus papatasi]
MEKDPESIATVQMKPEYAASEVYSTASEAPPAYKMRQSSSVQIAKIIAMTVIASSFIIGFFVLASAYLQAKASCDQMQTLDSVLEKELMLETLQDLPKAEALQAQSSSYKENSLQNDEKYSSPNGKEDPDAESISSSSSSDSDSESESNENGDINRLQIRLPLEFDLNDLTNALLEGNQKSRMNCVVERRRSEEFVDSPAKTMQLPFGLNISSDPKKQRITGERMAIFCESGTSQVNEEPSEPVRQVVMPIHAIPLNFDHQMPVNQPPPPPPQMPQMHQMPPQPMVRQMPPPPPPSPAQNAPLPIQVMQAPRPYQPEVRIQLQRVQIPRELLGEGGQEQQVQIQRVPLDVALHRAGITAEDLQNIQRMAEERIQQELKEMSGANEEDDDSDESSEEDDNKMVQMQQLPVPAQFLQMGRIGYGRSLLQPVKIPVPMMQQESPEQPQQSQEEQRPHFVQPRSVRSVDSVLHREKRVKRCACDCNC